MSIIKDNVFEHTVLLISVCAKLLKMFAELIETYELIHLTVM